MKLGVPFFFCFLYVFSLVLDSDGRRPQIVIDAIGYGFLLFCLLSLLCLVTVSLRNSILRALCPKVQLMQ